MRKSLGWPPKSTSFPHPHLRLVGGRQCWASYEDVEPLPVHLHPGPGFLGHWAKEAFQNEFWQGDFVIQNFHPPWLCQIFQPRTTRPPESVLDGLTRIHQPQLRRQLNQRGTKTWKLYLCISTWHGEYMEVYLYIYIFIECIYVYTYIHHMFQYVWPAFTPYQAWMQLWDQTRMTPSSCPLSH